MAAEDYERYLNNSRDALAALALVVEDPHLGDYDPHRSALREALSWLEMEVTCGDCVEGRCHWGGPESQASTLAAEAGRDYRDASGETCGCDRHEISVETRHRRARTDVQLCKWLPDCPNTAAGTLTDGARTLPACDDCADRELRQAEQMEV